MADSCEPTEVIFDIESAVLCGPAPLGQIEIPLRGGVTALYGLNGVGKSRTLDALDHLFRDQSPSGFLKLRVERNVALVNMLESKLEVDEEIIAAVSNEDVPWRGRGLEAALLGDWLACQWVRSFRGPDNARISGRLFGEPVLGAKRMQLIDEFVDVAEYLLVKRNGNWYLTVGLPLSGGPLSRESCGSVVAWWDEFLSRELAGTYEETLRTVDEQEIIEQLDDEWSAGRGERPAPGVFHPLRAPALIHSLGPLGWIFRYGWDPDDRAEARIQLAELVWWVELLRQAVQSPPTGNASVVYPAIPWGGGAIPCQFGDFVPAWFESHAPGSGNDEREYNRSEQLEPDGVIPVRSETELGSLEDCNDRMNERFWAGDLGGYPEPVLRSGDGGIVLASDVEAELMEFSDRSTALLQEFLPGSPQLKCDLVAQHAGVRPDLRWMARDESGVSVELTSLSPIQRRWALIAINDGFRHMHRGWSTTDEVVARVSAVSDWFPKGPRKSRRYPVVRLPVTSLTVIDEPEAGLHPSAASRVGTALRQRAISERGAVVVTTHSPQILGSSLDGAAEVYRSLNGSAQVRKLPPLSELRTDALGVSTADVLLLYRVVLIVEGQHDEVVLRALVGSELDQLGVLLLPIRGAKGAQSLADTAILVRTLSIPIVALFDNDRSGQLSEFWGKLQALEPNQAELIDELGKALPPSKEFPEGNYIKNLARELHALGPFSARRGHMGSMSG